MFVVWGASGFMVRLSASSPNPTPLLRPWPFSSVLLHFTMGPLFRVGSVAEYLFATIV